MNAPQEPHNGRPPLLDTLSRGIAAATSRRDAVRGIIAGVFGFTIVESCVSPTAPCAAGCTGNDGKCYSCSSGTNCSSGGGSGCSAPISGVYCCSGSSGGGGGFGRCPCNPGYVYNFSSGKCCDSATPYYYPGGDRINGAGCYATCPHGGECGTTFYHCTAD